LEHGKVVALGTPAALASTLGRSQNLKLEVAPGSLAAARSVAVSAGLREVEEVPVHPGRLTLAGAGRESIPDLVASLVGAGVRVYQVTPQEPSLEDVYFALHGESAAPAATGGAAGHTTEGRIVR
jgi:ABC-2 type transport system ATP-binding protein